MPVDAENLVVPTVDLGDWYGGDVTGRESVAASVDAAASALGFMQITGHGIPQQTIDAMASTSRLFFDQPRDVKMSVIPDDPATNRGYAPPLSESLSYSLGEAAAPDVFEAFNIGEDDVDVSDPFFAAERHRFFAPNIWPSSPSPLRAALVAYFGEARRIALTLTDVFAAALGLESGWFRPMVDRSTTTMRVINYETMGDAGPAGEGPLGMGAHTDYGVVTVLWSDDVPGLQIVDGEGRWRTAVADPGNLLVNLGDLTAQWTNDRWRSTLHRVVPPSAFGFERRQSAAFFLDGDWDARVECLSTCTSPDNPPRYPPVLAGEHLVGKLLGPREFRPSTATNTARNRRRAD